jgi:hypothetical protein
MIAEVGGPCAELTADVVKAIPGDVIYLSEE